MILSYFASCSTENRVEQEDISSINYENESFVDYNGYSEEEPLSAFQFPKGEALLFNDFIPEELKEELKACWIILFDRKMDVAYISCSRFQFDGYTMPVNGEIRNFPDFAKSWDIPENGCKVFFEGTAYQSSGGGTANQILIDYVLKSLKK